MEQSNDMNPTEYPDHEEWSKTWVDQDVPARKSPHEMMALVEERLERFVKTIQRRNWCEILASILLIPIFIFFALHSKNRLEQAGYWVIVASAVWIIYYLRAHRARSARPVPELSIQEY